MKTFTIAPIWTLLLGLVSGCSPQPLHAADDTEPRLKIEITHSHTNTNDQAGAHAHPNRHALTLSSHEYPYSNDTHIVRWQSNRDHPVPFSVVLPLISGAEWKTNKGKTNDTPLLFDTNKCVVIDSDTNFVVQLEFTKLLDKTNSTPYHIAVGQTGKRAKDDPQLIPYGYDMIETTLVWEDISIQN